MSSASARQAGPLASPAAQTRSRETAVGRDTLCVRSTPIAGPDRPLVPPIVQSTTYAWDGLEGRPPRSYAREGNPTVDALEAKLAALEGGGAAVCFGSGLAAIDAVVRLVGPGGRVVVGQHVYGGTTRLLGRIHHGIDVVTVDSSDNDAVAAALATPTDLAIIETPSNPTLRITDLRHFVQAAHGAGAVVAVDNTFATPLWQRPLELGADLSIHSTTKYLDGHDATLGGAVIVHKRHVPPEWHVGRGRQAPPASRSVPLSVPVPEPLPVPVPEPLPAPRPAPVDAEGTLWQRLRWIRCATGAVLAPFEAWLTLQGIKTLHLRTARQWQTAQRVARWLEDDGWPVHYPGLPSHPGHGVHASQCQGGGGIVAVDLGDRGTAARFVSSLRLWTLAENLGATESLVSSPALMTHAALPPERRRADGIPDGLVRLSAGIEDPDELLADLAQAIQAARTATVDPAPHPGTSPDSDSKGVEAGPVEVAWSS